MLKRSQNNNEKTQQAVKEMIKDEPKMKSSSDGKNTNLTNVVQTK